ncbi:MAG: hypothetical protein WEB05_07530 [Solirubrobacterales bacterium]
MTDLKKSFLALTTTAVLATTVLAGCSSSDKPAFCGDVQNLKDSISQLTSINIDAGVLDTVKTDLETVQTNAQTVVDSAKTDFPSESSALEDSVETAGQSIKELPASPSTAEIAAAALNVSAVATALKTFEDSTSSACN